MKQPEMAVGRRLDNIAVVLGTGRHHPCPDGLPDTLANEVYRASIDRPNVEYTIGDDLINFRVDVQMGVHLPKDTLIRETGLVVADDGLLTYHRSSEQPVLPTGDTWTFDIPLYKGYLRDRPSAIGADNNEGDGADETGTDDADELLDIDRGMADTLARIEADQHDRGGEVDQDDDPTGIVDGTAEEVEKTVTMTVRGGELNLPDVEPIDVPGDRIQESVLDSDALQEAVESFSFPTPDFSPPSVGEHTHDSHEPTEQPIDDEIEFEGGEIENGEEIVWPPEDQDMTLVEALKTAPGGATVYTGRCSNVGDGPLIGDDVTIS
jgi:hypothetical protein